MKAVVVEQIGSFSIVEREMPVPGAGEVLVRVTVTGLCRTDLKIIQVGHRDLTLPRIPGEEVVGVIEAVGPEVCGWLPGERVYIYPGTSCGQCPSCRAGAGNLCREMKIMGFHRDGGFAEFVVTPEKSLIRLPENITDEEAVFIEPLSCCLSALELARIREGESVAIWGGGPAGVLLERAVRARLADALVIDPDENRRAWSGGVSTPPDQLFDVCIVAVGAPEAYRESLDRLGPRGRLIVFSGLPREGAEVACDFNHIHYMEHSVIGAYGCSFRHGLEALDLISSGAVPVQGLVSHRLPLEELSSALDRVARRDCMKIHLYPAAEYISK